MCDQKNRLELHRIIKYIGSLRIIGIIGRPFDLSGGPLIFLEKIVCIQDTFLRESCIYLGLYIYIYIYIRFIILMKLGLLIRFIILLYYCPLYYKYINNIYIYKIFRFIYKYIYKPNLTNKPCEKKEKVKIKGLPIIRKDHILFVVYIYFRLFISNYFSESHLFNAKHIYFSEQRVLGSPRTRPHPRLCLQ